MANAITVPGKVFLGSNIFPINGLVREHLVPAFPQKVSMGPDDFDNQLVLSSINFRDQRGGILIDEMDEAVHTDRCWWTNCITDYDGHLTLPRLAIEISTFPTTPISAIPSLANVDMELASDWSVGNGGARSATQALHGTYSWAVPAGQTESQDAATWNNDWRSDSFTFQCWVWAVNAAAVRINIADGQATTNSSFHGGGSDWELLTVTRTLHAAASVLTCTLDNGDGVAAYFDCATIYSPFVDAGLGPKANFNGELYIALGSTLCKLKSGRTELEYVQGFPVTITDLKKSLNNRLYIALGESNWYCWMDTSEAFTAGNDAVYWFESANAKLFSFNISDGTVLSSTDPDATVSDGATWSSEGTLTEVESTEFKHPVPYMDADGADILYWPTTGTLFAHDDTNNKWYPTRLRLSGNPNAGHSVFWKEGLFLSSGLNVRRYITGATATIVDMGLDREGGLPVEYNGEIMFLADGGENELFALVDASQTSGNSPSGLYAYDGRGWKCWWVDTANNGAMISAIVSDAESGYALYWDCGGTIFYIDINRGVRNPKKLPGTQTYAAAGIWVSGWMDYGTAVYNKTLASLYTFAKGVGTNETIAVKYKIDHTDTTIAGNWTTLDTLNTSGENGVNEEVFASAGVATKAVQLGFDLARGGTSTNSPDLQAFGVAYKKTGLKKAWTFEVNLSGSDKTAKTLYDALITAANTTTFLEFTFKNSNNDSTQTHYVFLSPFDGMVQTGESWDGTYRLTVVEP